MADSEQDIRAAQPDAAEPAGDQDPANEADRLSDSASGGGQAPAEAEEGAGAAEGEEGAGAGEAEQGAAAAAEGSEPEEPEDELAVAQRERGEYLALAQRTQADFENYRKRAARDTAAAGERAKSGLARELLPVVDNLERALDSTAAAAARGDGAEEHLADGVRLVHSELIAVLGRNGVEAFDPRGEKFDPDAHEALSTRPDEGAEAGDVLDVVEKGYSLNGSVLRPARVVVCG